MILEQLGQDKYLLSRWMDWRIRDGEVLVTNLFSNPIHSPLVFIIQNKNGLHGCSPHNIKTTDTSLSFNTNVDMEGKLRIVGDDLLIKLSSQNSKIGIMVPTNYADVFFSDNLDPINNNFTASAYYHISTEDPTVFNIHLPIIHLNVKNVWISVAQNNIHDPVEFNYFLYNGKPYINIITQNTFDFAFRYFVSKRDSFSDFYRRFGYIKNKPIVSHSPNINQVKQALMTNRDIVSPTLNSDILTTAKLVQELLSPVKCSLIGSSACMLHGINVNTQDIDLAVESIEQAKTKLSNFELHSSTNEKWRDCSFRFNFQNIQVDCTELNFDWSSVETINGIKVLKKKELLLMKLIGEFERSVMSPNDLNFKTKNQDNIFSLLEDDSYIYPFFKNFLDVKFDHLLSLMRNATWSSIKVRINHPLQINAFISNEVLILPIINNGIKIPAEVNIEHNTIRATYHDLSGGKHDCHIENGIAGKRISIPEIDMMGVLCVE